MWKEVIQKFWCHNVTMSQCHKIIILASENQMFKILYMKITKTALDVFNIWLRRAKGCELTYAKLNAILASMECSINPVCEGLPLDYMKEVNEKLYSARKKMLKHEKIKKSLR